MKRFCMNNLLRVILYTILLGNYTILYSQEKWEQVLSYPTAAELGSFGRTSVGLFTGTNQVSVPLYEIKTKNLTYPISLNYSSNGFKVDKVSSNVGFDWTLNAEGVIIRIVRGLPDDYGYFELYPANLDPMHIMTEEEQEAEVSFYNSWEFNTVDVEPDIYSYNFCGYSGQFYTDYANDGKIVMVPFQNLKVEYSNDMNTPPFSITDTKGIRYIFEIGEKTKYTSLGYSESTYYLTKIIHPAGDSIIFNYSILCDNGSISNQYAINISDNLVIADNVGQDGECPSSYSPAGNGPLANSNESFTLKCLSSIVAPGYGSVEFHYKNDRFDFMMPRIDSIVIFNNDGDIIRSISLYQQYPSTTSFSNLAWYNEIGNDDDYVIYRMFLDSVIIRDIQSLKIQKYAFDYNSIDELPVRMSYAQDHWGYFNGQRNLSLLPDVIPTSIRQEFFQNFDSSRMKANRDANYLFAQKGMLSKVTFPTRGFTTYEYEPHRSQGHLDEEHGGVRLKAQYSYHETSKLAYKTTYSYSGGNSGWDIHDAQYYFSGIQEKHCCYNFGSIFPGIGNTTFNVYWLQSQPLYSLALTGGIEIGYQKVTVLFGDSIENVGKEEHEFEIGFDDYYRTMLLHCSREDDMDSFFPHPYVNSGWKSGTLLKEKYYRNISGDYSVTKEIIYKYLEDSSNSITNYYPTIKCYDFETIHCEDGIDYDYIGDFFKVAYYWNISKWRYLSEKIEKDYDDNGVVMITDTTHYYYDNPVHAQLSRKKSSDSQGNTIKTEIYYPDDYTTSSYNLETLRTNNIIDIPIDTRRYVNSFLSEGQQITYNDKGQPTDIYKAETNGIDVTFTPSDPYTFTHEASYSYDCYNNPNQVIKENNFTTTYIWSYDNTLPVAKGENIDYKTLESLFNTAVSSSGMTDYSELASVSLDDSEKANLRSFNTAIRSNLPVNALITTYTYAPLIGMTSQTDPNGVTTYYEYDGFGRLKFIKDDDGNILKSYEYNYQQ